MSDLLAMFSYSYMVRALISGIIVSVLMALIGNIVVHKRLSMIGDSLSHTSLAGISIGLVAGLNPILGAVIACLVGAFAIEGIRTRLKNHSELAVAIILSLGVGISGVMSGFVKSATDFSSYLFGSIIATTIPELIAISVIGAVIIVTYILLYRSIFLISFDEQSARMLGVNVGLINTLITFLTAITIAISTRIVGTLIISSLMVVPVAAALEVARSYKKQVVLSVVFSVVSTLTGLVLSFEFGLKPGGVICLVSVFIFFMALIWGRFCRKR
ncbi:MAG: metal ABC transporter permease [Clostridia bacterium]|nr:metal ABC transporter permease [Clostridia bacterium]